MTRGDVTDINRNCLRTMDYFRNCDVNRNQIIDTELKEIQNKVY